jgi:hypothetical protein
LPLFARAQTNLVTLTGSIEVTTGEIFPYKLVFTETGGTLKGYSLTYQEPNETKSSVTGTLDKRNRTLTFKETGIIYSSGYHTKAYMCLVDAHLEHVHNGNGNVLTGPLTSKEADKTVCTGGTVTFGKAEEIQNLFSYHDPFDTVIVMKKKVKGEATESKVNQSPLPAASLSQVEVTKGIVKTYDWHSDTVVIDIWDGGNVDGDRVTILFNGKNYLNNYSLLKQKKNLKIPLSDNAINTLAIIAGNEGTDPPNTASLMLTDGNIHYSVLAYNKTGDQAIIKIKKAP